MGSLVLGVAGAAIGFFVGGGPTGAMIGWTLGSLAGSLLFPAKQQVARLDDTKVQGAEYGTMRPILFGMMRVGGIGCGQGSTENGPNQFTEHEETSGGKGGPEVTNFRYTLSFFNEICEGVIVGVNRRWANSRLITAADAQTSGIWPYTLYLGDAAQMPDPTMELVYGAGEVSPIRGIAYESVEEIDVGDFGGARPNVEYEAFTKGGSFPSRVASFRPWPTAGSTFHYSAVYEDGVITVASEDIFGTVYHRAQYSLDGTQIGTTTTGGGSGGSPIHGVRNLNGVFAASHGAGPPSWSVPDLSDETQILLGAEITVGPIAGNSNIYMNESIYTVGDSGGFSVIARFAAPDGIPGTFIGAGGVLDDLYTASSVFLGTSDTGDVYVIVGITGAAKMWKFDANNLALVHFWDVADTSATRLNGVGNFHVSNNQVVFKYESGGLSYVSVVQISGTALSDVGSLLLSANTVSQNFVVSLGGCLLLDEMGVVSLCATPAKVILGEDIVKPLLKRGGLTDAQIDVSDLTQEVRGFLVGSQMTVHNAIDTLRKGFFFDVTEYDGKVVCRNRGHDANIDAIPDGELGAHEPGSEPPEPLETIRTPEDELPQTVWVSYYDVDKDYQRGSQPWSRTVTSSKAKVTLELPIAFTASEALHAAQWHMHFAWLERERFIWYTDRSWSHVTPTDVWPVRGRSIRVTNKTEEPSGRIKWEGVTAFAGPYTPYETIPGEIGGAPGSGQPPQVPPGTQADTGLILLDVPLISETGSATAIRAAIYKDGAGSWSGGGLYKSVDGGTSYALSTSLVTSTIVGTVASAVGDFLGGNVPDESNVLTVVLAGDQTLESTNDDGLLNGLNLVAYGSPATGWELLQYRTATLTAARTYRITGLMRGRFGTEWRIGTHSANELFVVMAGTVEVPGGSAEINVARTWKGVTFGTALADAVAVTFTNTGVAARCYSPAHFAGGIGPAGEVIAVWTERTRTGGAWKDFADIIQADSPATFVWEVWDATYTICGRSVGGLTSPTYSYSSADQVTDFGALQSAYYATVAQVGAFGLGVRTRAVLPGAGAVINAPVAPVPPYNPPAVPPVGGGGTVDKVLAYPSDIYVTAGYKIGDTFVAQFTTGGASPTGGYISTSQYSDGPAYARHVRLCTDAAGINLVPGGEQWGNTCTILWAAVTLAPSTTYYFWIRSELGDGSPSGPMGAPAEMRVNLLAT